MDTYLIVCYFLKKLLLFFQKFDNGWKQIEEMEKLRKVEQMIKEIINNRAPKGVSYKGKRPKEEWIKLWIKGRKE